MHPMDNYWWNRQARMNANLEAKLAARRHRRARINVETKQSKALKDDGGKEKKGKDRDRSKGKK